jgi:DeoR family transcriptional regulator, fructose operon transcriptional repressor
MPAEARRIQIIDILSQTGNGVIAVGELAQQLGVSEMTIRRDLDWLEQRAILTRVHGGAMAFQKDLLQRSEEKPFDDRLNESNAQKKAIGWAAAQLVKDGDRIILDAGTTMQQLARNLGGKNGLTVITNNIPVATELSRYPQIETILLGGILKHQEMCTLGPMVKQGVSILSVDKYFMSASGITVRNGATDPDMREAEVKQAMMQAAGEIILVADSSKFGLVKLVKICPIQSLRRIVTDDTLPAQTAAELEAEGVEIITPERFSQNP